MVKTKRVNQGVTKIASKIGIGGAIALLIMLSAAAVGAYLLSAEIINIEQCAIFCTITAGVATAIGCWYSSAAVGRMKMQICLMTAAVIYLTELLLSLLFFGGELKGAGRGALAVFIGSIAVALLSLMNKKKPKFRIRKNAYR